VRIPQNRGIGAKTWHDQEPNCEDAYYSFAKSEDEMNVKHHNKHLYESGYKGEPDTRVMEVIAGAMDELCERCEKKMSAKVSETKEDMMQDAVLLTALDPKMKNAPEDAIKERFIYHFGTLAWRSSVEARMQKFEE
jgi:hypothetical protein